MTNDFMKPDIQFGDWWEIETSSGTEFVPGDLVRDECVSLGDIYNPENCEWFDDVANQLSQYCEGDIQEFRLRKGVGARLSAPGYMDVTSWCVFDTREEAVAYLRETYGVGDGKDPDELTQSEAKEIIREIQEIMYPTNNPVQDWGSDELGAIEALFIKYGLAPEDI